MEIEEACLILGLDSEFSEDSVQKSYDQLWRNTELLRFTVTQADRQSVEDKLGRLNRARAVLFKHLNPNSIN